MDNMETASGLRDNFIKMSETHEQRARNLAWEAIYDYSNDKDKRIKFENEAFKEKARADVYVEVIRKMIPLVQNEIKQNKGEV